MLARFTLDQLQTFVAVAECGSFTAASRKLNRVQSAVSHAIQSLEQALNLQLFDRTQKLPRLTDAGAALLADAQRVLANVEGLSGRAKEINGLVEPDVRLAIEQVFPNELLIHCLKQFHDRFPSTSVTLYGDGLGAPQQSLEDHSSAVAIYSPVTQTVPGISLSFFGHVPITVVAAVAHPLAQIEGLITNGRLDEHVQLILADRARRTRGIVMGARTWSFVDQNSRLDFILNGFGWSLMPQHLARAHLDSGALVELQLEIYNGRRLLFPLYSAYRTDTPPGPATLWLLQQLRQQFEAWSEMQLTRHGEGNDHRSGIEVRVTYAERAKKDLGYY